MPKIRIEQIRGDGDVSKPKVLVSDNGSVYWGDAPATPTPDSEESTPPTKSVSFPSGFGANMYATRIGNIVMLQAGGISTNTPNNGTTNLGEKIPVGFRPAREMRVVFRMIAGRASTGAGVYYLRTDGTMILHTTTSHVSEIHGSITYVTNDPFPA